MYIIIYIYLTTFKTKGKKSTVAKDLLKQNDKYISPVKTIPL